MFLINKGLVVEAKHYNRPGCVTWIWCEQTLIRHKYKSHCYTGKEYIFRAAVELAKFSVIAFMLSRACRCSSEIRRKFLAAVDNRLYVSPLLIPLHFITELRRIGHDKERRSRTKEYFWSMKKANIVRSSDLTASHHEDESVGSL